jgi:hypothetical protein
VILDLLTLMYRTFPQAACDKDIGAALPVSSIASEDAFSSSDPVGEKSPTVRSAGVRDQE